MLSKNTKSILQFLLLLTIGIFLMWLSLKQITPEQKTEIVSAFKNANYLWIVLAMAIAFLSHFLRAYRWNYLLKPVGYKTKLLNATCHVLVGYFANYGIPRMGEISRCTLASKYDDVPFEVAFGTVITERIIDFILFLGIFILTLAFQFNELIGLANELIFDKLSAKTSHLSLGSIALVVFISLSLIAFIILLRKKITKGLKGKFGSIIKGMGAGIGSIRKMENPIQFILLSLAIWACYFYSLYFCFFAIPGTSHLGQKECLTLLLFGTFGVMFSPGGLGAYPAIVGGILLYTFKVDVVSSVALPWLSWTSQFLLIVVLGIVSLIILPIFNRNKNVVSRTT